MIARKITRRQMLTTAAAGAIGTLAGIPVPALGKTGSAGKLALFGGEKVHSGEWPQWPQWDQSAESRVVDMLRSGRWWRGSGEHVAEFEKKYAQLMGARRCLATASGSTALMISLHVSGVDAGDEVIVSPYTFIASYNVIFQQKALPVFADTDPETFLINPLKIEERITDRTTAILPVHIYGLPADMDPILEIARQKNLKVVEDACQAWLGEYKGRKLGTIGDLGCFSFQNSKNLPTGEGGAILGNDEAVMDRCHSVHNCGRPYGSVARTSDYPIRGSNRRMQQIQAIMLLSQMERIERDAALRLENARYLDEKFKEIPGIRTARLVAENSRSACHMYPFRYLKEFFNDIPREKFLQALRAEGIPCSPGYGRQNKDGLMEEAITSRGYKRLFSEARLNRWREENQLPGNDQLSREAVIFSQSMLLAGKKEMDDIAAAIGKIYENRHELAKPG